MSRNREHNIGVDKLSVMDYIVSTILVLATKSMKLEEAIAQKQFCSEYEKLAVNLQYTATVFRLRLMEQLKPFNLSPEQFNILRILRGQHPKPATVKLLIERMLDRSPNVSRLVEKLRAKGYVERHECPEDRRAVDVLITKHGLDLLAEIDRTLMEAPHAKETLSIEQARQLNHLLDQLRG